MNKLREKINKNEQVLGTLVSLTDPCLCEIMGNIGYDAVWIDLEHTYISEKDVLCHLNASRASNIPAVVRVPQDDLTITKKVLEMDVDGIIFPMVKSVEEAKRLIETTLYPPYGTRGIGPMRAMGYGAKDVKEYVEKTSFELCRFIQIEHTDCIDALEEMVKLPFIDGFIFGPNDLSMSVGDPLNVFGKKNVNEMMRAIAVLRKHNKRMGIACGMQKQALEFWMQFKPDMIFAGADWNFVYACGEQTLKELKKLKKEQ